MFRTLFSIALVACAILLVGTARGNAVDDFLQAMQQDIANGNVQAGGSGFSSQVPLGLGNEGIWGYTYWPSGDTAACTWVRARATDSAPIAAWTHTTWSPVAPQRNYVYLHNRSMPQPIEKEHAYYIKGLHWLPGSIREFPPKNQPGPTPPPEAQGVVYSPTYHTQVWHGGLLQTDVCLSGPAAMW